MSSTNAQLFARPRPVVLCILDGWGRPTGMPDDAITAGKTPTYDRLTEDRACALLQTSGTAVGLPEGQMGNSEVGHMNLGGGRVVKQNLPRIDEAVHTGDLGRTAALQQLIATLKLRGGACHLMGLVSPGGVHSHQNHIVALAREVAAAGIQVHLHAFLDGRDTPPKSALEYISELESELDAINCASISTVCGRYYAMDRDQRWDRIEQAYKAIAGGLDSHALSASDAINDAYQNNISDEFIAPVVITGYGGMADGDGVLMANFRADRAREIMAAFVDPDFDGFNRQTRAKLSCAAGMVEYSATLATLMSALFPPQQVVNSLGEIVAKAGLTQLRIAETEKYAHVTFFFNGGSEAVFADEERILVPSPKVATYDLKPEMAAIEVTDRLVEAINNASFDFIVVNYANPDMVGHTGDFTAAISAVETIDTCLARLCEAVEMANGVLVITADHGNIEKMKDIETNQSFTAHTTNVVPLILAVAPESSPTLSIEDGRLADVAPTLLRFMGLPQPVEMTGQNLTIAVSNVASPAPSSSTAKTGLMST
jgi:2,3-bisphosphoglycerate-independent phosphoglycerate mutase